MRIQHGLGVSAFFVGDYAQANTLRLEPVQGFHHMRVAVAARAATRAVMRFKDSGNIGQTLRAADCRVAYTLHKGQSLDEQLQRAVPYPVIDLSLRDAWRRCNPVGRKTALDCFAALAMANWG